MLVPPAVVPLNEKGEEVDPVVPNSEPVAGAVVVVDCPEAALDAGVPKEKDILAVVRGVV